MEKILKQHCLILVMVPLVLLSGCSIASASAATTQAVPTTLQVHRVNLISANHYRPFSPRTITNQQEVQRLYNAMQALPHRNTTGSAPQFCPQDAGLEYQLDFFQEHTLIQEAIFDPEGCSSVRIGKTDIRVAGESFAQLFAQTLGISRNELTPRPLCSCTPHSSCSSSAP